MSNKGRVAAVVVMLLLALTACSRLGGPHRTGGGPRSHDRLTATGFFHVREKDGRRVFYTSLGHKQDFANPAFTRLLTNALRWAAGLPSTPEASK